MALSGEEDLHLLHNIQDVLRGAFTRCSGAIKRWIPLPSTKQRHQILLPQSDTHYQDIKERGIHRDKKKGDYFFCGIRALGLSTPGVTGTKIFPTKGTPV